MYKIDSPSTFTIAAYTMPQALEMIRRGCKPELNVIDFHEWVRERAFQFSSYIAPKGATLPSTTWRVLEESNMIHRIPGHDTRGRNFFAIVLKDPLLFPSQSMVANPLDMEPADES